MRAHPAPVGCFALLGALATIALGACEPGAAEAGPLVPGGDVERGRAAFVALGCGACHAVDGVREARGRVGPPLSDFGLRTMIAGEVPNTPANLVRWLRDPQAIEPTTAMPNLGVDEQTARDVAAYLYTRR
ncbi:MAG TPA: c-type cytochrome [Gemmatimonadales bacterium]|nr:c-type cytochrome [Gemmatimonadales bacterium]